MAKVIKFKDYTYLYGTIIEKGSNTNGYYIKYSDGTLIQWNHLSVTDQAINTQYGGTALYFGIRTITYPIPFYETASISFLCCQFKWGTSGSWGNTYSYANTEADIIGYDYYPRATGTNCDISWIAIGRWK